MAEDRHVRFGNENDEAAKSNTIVIQKAGDDRLQVHLGFLKYLHVYEITVSFRMDEHSSYFDWTEEWQIDETVTSPCCRLLNVLHGQEEVRVLVEFRATKIKLLRETLQLCSSGGKKLSVVFLSRVLGKEQGTPMLRDGIHCTGLLPDDESDATDWQGFE